MKRNGKTTDDQDEDDNYVLDENNDKNNKKKENETERQTRSLSSFQACQDSLFSRQTTKLILISYVVALFKTSSPIFLE